MEAGSRSAAAKDPTLVLVTGMPGAGKTTLARALATELCLPLVCRDDIKVAVAQALADVPGAPAVGPWHVAVFWQIVRSLLATAPVVVAETAADPELVAANLLALPAGTRIRCVHVDVSIALAHRRYRDRAMAGTRHPVHGDLVRADLMLDNPQMYAEYAIPPTLPDSAGAGSGLLRVSGAEPFALHQICAFALDAPATADGVQGQH